MTRETKIGLLVGLAFIIVIGILLSDHLTSTNDPSQAALGTAGNGVRQAVNSPGASGAASPVTVVTPVVTPQQTVPTQAELTTPTPAVQLVNVHGPVSQPPAASAQADLVKNQPVANDTPVNNAPPLITPVSNTPVATDSELSKVAEAHGEKLVNADDKPAAGAAKAYVAQPGDSLSKIAARFLGTGSKANRDLIVKANPSLAANQDMVIAGKTYQIPAAAEAKATEAKATVDDSDAKTAGATETAEAKVASDSSYVYIVQPGDNLTRIARDEVGDIRAIAAIQELNPDKLKGTNHDIVIAGSKLHLPGKKLARAE